MARYERSYTGERATYHLHVKLTPSQGAQLEAAFAASGAANLSQFARELLFRRLVSVVSEGTRRNPETRALRDAINAVGNNLNQLMRHGNTTGELGAARLADVDDVLHHLKAAARRVVDL